MINRVEIRDHPVNYWDLKNRGSSSILADSVSTLSVKRSLFSILKKQNYKL